MVPGITFSVIISFVMREFIDPDGRGKKIRFRQIYRTNARYEQYETPNFDDFAHVILIKFAAICICTMELSMWVDIEYGR